MQISLKHRLIFMSFMQFFVWGAWLITVANYWFGTLEWGNAEFGAIFSTMGFSAIFMPTLTGIIADRWINAEKLYGLLHILGGVALACIPSVKDPTTFFWVIFAAMICYMPTLSLSNSVSYHALKSRNYDLIKTFPPIRVWGTVGFIAAMWVTNISGLKASAAQFYVAAAAAFVLGIYAFTLPACPPLGDRGKKTFREALGLDAFKLFGDYKMLLFFLFSMLLGAALQLTNMYGDVYVDQFKHFGEYADSVVVRYSTLIMSISQISETLFILAIPFFLKRFGIKQVMLLSMIAWVLRFALLAYGNPAEGLWLIIVSCIVYGMAFDFFNISGSLFMETNVSAKIRSSAQGLFMMMTNGFGAVLGSTVSGILIDRYFTLPFATPEALTSYLHITTKSPAYLELTKGNTVLASGEFTHPVMLNDWQPIWLCFAAYAFVIAVLFGILFRHKHAPEEVKNFEH
jgi:MFS transporter, NHS family, xanthosine permease